MHASITLDPSLRDNESASCDVKPKHEALVTMANAKALRAAAEALDALNMGASLSEIELPSGVIIDPTSEQIDEVCREVDLKPLKEIPKGGWFGPIFMMASLDPARAAIIAANPILDYCRAHGLKPRREGREWVCSCPLHEERTPSFKINPEKQVFRCHGETMRQLAGKGAREARSEVAVYDYQDAAGKVVFQVVRYSDKTFLPRQRVNGRWVWNIKGVERVPYRLPELLAKPASVWVVEGEKDVETLREAGQTSTCNPFGAGKWRPEYSEHLRGLHVWVVPDGDEIGREHAREVFASLKGIAASIRCLDLPSEFNGKQIKDVSDLRVACDSEDAFFDALAKLQQQGKEQVSRSSSIVEEKEEAPKPKLSPEAFYGILGEITRFIEPQTEADPAAVLFQLLIAFGNHVGRKAFFQVEQSRHYANLYVILIGKTAIGRKGTALDHIKAIMTQADPFYITQFASGLSTGEELIWHVRDPITATHYDKKKKTSENVVIDKGVEDKRLFVVESEFARPHRAMARPTNTLSTVIREAWDSKEGHLGTMTKNQSTRATGAHISMAAHITEEELNRELPECDFFNGFANRFLWSEVERSKLLPDGGKLNRELLKQHADTLAKALASAAEIEEMTRDDEAQALWREVYPELSRARPAMLGAVTSRAESQVLRISMILVLSDGSSKIGVEHLRAALALWDYCYRSACRFFGQRLTDSKAQKILDALRQKPAGMTRKQILDEVFGRNLSAEALASALALLLKSKLAYCKAESTEGRTAERWFAQT